MSDTSDDVLRDLLLARGISGYALQALMELTTLTEWCGDADFVGSSIDEVADDLRGILMRRSREYAPQRPPQPMPSFAELNSIFREAWGRTIVWNPDDFRLREALRPSTLDDTSPGWLSRMQQPNPRDDEPR
jgi:hypothetical protein